MIDISFIHYLNNNRQTIKVFKMCFMTNLAKIMSLVLAIGHFCSNIVPWGTFCLPPSPHIVLRYVLPFLFFSVKKLKQVCLLYKIYCTN